VCFGGVRFVVVVVGCILGKFCVCGGVVLSCCWGHLCFGGPCLLRGFGWGCGWFIFVGCVKFSCFLQLLGVCFVLLFVAWFELFWLLFWCVGVSFVVGVDVVFCFPCFVVWVV